MTGLQDGPPATASVASAELALRVVGTEHHGRIVRLRSAKCSIGSAAGCTLRLRGEGIRELECVILRSPRGVAVRAWSEAAKLNGHAFVAAPLIAGDRLSLGSIELEVLDPQALPRTAAATSPTDVDRRRFEQLEHEAQAAAAARDALAKQMAEHDEHVARLCAELAEAERLVEQLRKEAESPAADEQEVDVAALEARIEQLVAQRQAAEKERESERELWHGERDKLLATVEQLTNEFERFKAAAQAEHKRVHAEVDKAARSGNLTVQQHRELREMEVAITHWRERCEEQTAKASMLEQRIAELQASDADRSSPSNALQLELEAAARQLDADTERLLEREQTLDDKILAWEAQQAAAAADVQAQREQIAAELAELARRRQAVEDEIQLARRASEEELAAARQQLAALRSEIEQRQAILEEREAALAEEWNRLEEERQALLAHPIVAATPTREDEQPETDEPSAATNTAEVDSAPYQPPSASDIIAKLSASGLWKDDAPANESAAEPERPEPAWKALVPEAEIAKPAAPPAPAAEEDDSIEAYMQRLLKRVSGDNAPSTWKPAADSSSTSTPVDAASDENEAASASGAEEQPVEEPFDFQTYVPRAAPELTANLAAMRELANSSARTAIDTSSKRKQARRATSKLVLAVSAIGTAVALGWLSMRTHSLLSYYAALSAGLAALLWGLHAGYLWVRARWQKG